jgi:hypothetical protein
VNGRGERLRQHHIAPLTWELPTLAALSWAALTCAVPLGVQGLAGRLAGGRWVWPTGHELDSLMAIAHGHFGIGLTASDQGSLPPSPLLWTLTAVAELMVTLAAAIVAIHGSASRQWSGHGLAGRAHARRALGARALMRRGPVLRPDLFHRHRHRAPERSEPHPEKAAPGQPS